MQNDAPPDPPLNPFQSAFGSKARDPASLDRAMREAELEKSQSAADDFEFRHLDWAPFAAPLLWLFGMPGWALAAWAGAVLLASPVYLWQIDQRRPCNDIARAAALHAYGLLGWPVGFLAFMASGSWMVAFPFVFGIGGGAFLWAGREHRPAPPSGSRAAFLAGAAVIYALSIVAAAALLWWLFVRPDEVGGFALGVMFLAAAYSILPILGAVQLSRAASRAWRERATAAAPASD